MNPSVGNLWKETRSHYFFLYPVGHFGFTSETFLTALPLTHVIVIFFITDWVVSDGLGDADGLCVGCGNGVGDCVGCMGCAGCVGCMGCTTVEAHGGFTGPPGTTFGFRQRSPEYGAVP